jgi:hypothetical protein
MLQCSMNHPGSLQLALEDVLASLWNARRSGDIARLAHVGFTEVQRWARARRDDALMARARALLTDCPYRNRDEFLFAVDRLIDEVEHAHVQLVSHDHPPLGLVRAG